MGKLSNITNEERLRCFAGAVSLARAAIREEPNFLNPGAKLGSLSDFEWDKLVSAIVSGWIVERSRQVTLDKIETEAFLAMDKNPEPQELGVCAAVLPALGEAIEKMELADKPIGDWSKMNVCMLVWVCGELLARAKEPQKHQESDELKMVRGG